MHLTSKPWKCELGLILLILVSFTWQALAMSSFYRVCVRICESNSIMTVWSTFNLYFLHIIISSSSVASCCCWNCKSKIWNYNIWSKSLSDRRMDIQANIVQPISKLYKYTQFRCFGHVCYVYMSVYCQTVAKILHLLLDRDHTCAKADKFYGNFEHWNVGHYRVMR